MALDPNLNVSVPDLGDFIFRKRKVPDQIRIQADALRLMGGPCEDPDLVDVSMAWATLKLLQVSAPAEWDMDKMDPLDRDDMDKMWKVWRALRDEEVKFRKAA